VPARGVADRGVDILEGDGEVDEIEVEVVDAPVGELLADDGLDALTIVEGVPELGDDEELLALHDTLLDGAGDTLTALDLVAIVSSAIEEAVAGLDGLVDGVGSDGVVDLPETEAHLGHVMAAGELDAGDGNHFDWLVG